jgi:amino acid permease
MTAADILNPEFHSPSRKSTVVVTGFNLTASIMGGGILSIPFAFSKTGMLLGPLLMLVAAIVTERSMYLLCLCSRLTGAKTYGEVGEAAFGKSMEYFISCILCVFLFFAIIGYMVLAKDIWTSVLMVVGVMETPANDELVLGAIIILIVPFLVQKSLYALRFNCYVGFISVSTLCVALVRHAWATPVWSDIMWWSTDLEDVLVAFPIISLSFLGIFNILPIQNALIKPSRSRVLLVVDGAIFAVLAMSLIFGSAGYLFAGSKTGGNILMNCDTAKDLNLLLGQLGCGIMVVLAIPMMMLPCRECLLEVLDVLVNGPHITPVEVEESEQLPLITADTKSTDNTYNAIHTAGKENQQQSVSEETPSARRGINHKMNITDNTSIHYSSTFVIFATCYMVAIRVPGVAVVWSILGCSLGYLIAFILPCVCYLRIQKRYPSHTLDSKGWVWFSWILSMTSVAAMLVCTAEAVKGLK